MSEQYPLLCDDLSEEEARSPRYRRLLMSKARARNQVKGAAAIISRWPGQWTTLLNYWWIAIGMLALTTYVLYNSIYIYLAHSYKLQRTPIERPRLDEKFSTHIATPVPLKVFMHVIVEDKQEVNLDNYLPYITIITNKFKHFQFELVIVTNDTSVETKELTDKDNNELAMSILWNDNTVNKIVKNSNDNLKIKYVTLSKYFYDSPLKKHWKHLPQQLKKFLVRGLSVWQKGGIAFDPIVLTPQSPSSIYIEKIYNILKKYKLKKRRISSRWYTSNKKTNLPTKVIPNNIQDIINALDEENTSEKYFQDPLMEAETRDVSVIDYERKAHYVTDNNVNEVDQMKPMKFKETEKAESKFPNQEKRLDSKSKFNLLPMFLEYLFHNKITKQTDETTLNPEIIQHVTTLPIDFKHNANNENTTVLTKEFWNYMLNKSKHETIIINTKEILDKPNNESKIADVIEKEVEDLFEVTIDLKGNVVATDTACHAFIGSILNDAIHINESETVTEFIIKELSSFCRGLLASCVGIDIILL